MAYTIRYPRRRLIRSLMRGVGRLLLPLLTELKITGMENFPRQGPVILVGNHTAVMEAVLMTVYPPKQVEFMGATDLPFQGIAKPIAGLYGQIPVFRGNVSRESMRMGLDGLKQDGFIGIFPEGGYWEPVVNQAQSGVAWLSHRSQAPILPIGFGDTRGMLPEIFSLKRPELVMNVGKLLPPVQLQKGKNRKAALQEQANAIMDAVWELVPEEVLAKKHIKENEVFELEVKLTDAEGHDVDIPVELEITQGKWLSRYIHRFQMINLMRDQLQLPVDALKALPDGPPLDGILTAYQAVIDYIHNDNPYFFTYRYGQKGGTEMLKSFFQFKALAEWAREKEYKITAIPIHKYTDPKTKERKTLIEPDEYLFR